MLSCQLTFIPLFENNAEEKILEILKLIEDAGLNHQVGKMATQVVGECKAIFALLAAIDEYCNQNQIYYHIPMMISNYCGCEDNRCFQAERHDC